MTTWDQKWLEATEWIKDTIPYTESAKALRGVIRTGLLKYTDMEDDPELFFHAHRLLTDPGNRGPGFAIRFTVQYNLFAGTVLGLGGPEHIQELHEMQSNGTLGCFGLTEKYAGVSSGLVVNTTCTWQPSNQTYILNTPNHGATKNWISQGLTADKCTVIADLIIDGKSYGPHGFLMDLRRNGEVVDGVVLGDMGLKTTGNDLDNAWIKFENVVLGKHTLLNRYSDIIDNKYVQKTKQKMRIEIIGMRLLSGRIAVAQAALTCATKLFAKTKEFSDQKKCWSPAGPVTLSSVPQLTRLYQKADVQFKKVMDFSSAVESALNVHLRKGTVPPPALVAAIAVCKVKSVEVSIELAHRLKQEVGSYALMVGTGFEHMDFLNCCKFAEGDSRIMMLKLARDRFGQFRRAMKKAKQNNTPVTEPDREQTKCIALAKAMSSQGAKAWLTNSDIVYALAEDVMESIMTAWLAPRSKL